MRLLPLKNGHKLRRYAAGVLAAAVVSVAGFVSSPPAHGALRDNLAHARMCLHDGWKTLTRADGSSFRNMGACVVYALFGGNFGSSTSTGGTGGTGGSE